MGISANYSAVFHNGGRMNKGGFINHESGLPATSTHHGCFAHNFTVDQRNPFKAGQATARFLESDFRSSDRWHHRTLKARFINTREIIQFAGFQFPNAFKRQNTGCLRHRFQNQHAGKIGLPGKCPRKNGSLTETFSPHAENDLLQSPARDRPVKTENGAAEALKSLQSAEYEC